MCSGLRVGKNFACLKTASLVFRLDLLPPRYLSADNGNEVRLHKHLHTKTLQKMADFRKENNRPNKW